ncbi:hypothetical protein RS030_71133 [Cryptosporidium xiaoi]|uniref:Inner centromere protein ARK-binding domain-containing protein n=1 Tax=Cryptosporidium xiaoi TaxID=659607 RepID=A0AAV9XVL6_9CRYT
MATDNTEIKIDKSVINSNNSSKMKNLENILNLIEDAKKSSFERLNETLSRIEKNYENNLSKYEEGFISLDYKMFDIDIPEMEVNPTENEISRNIINFLSEFVDRNKSKSNKINNSNDSCCTENKNNIKDICLSPAPKRTRNEEEESSFVASIIRLWENKTPKISSIWRKNKDEKFGTKRFGVSKMESLNIVSIDKVKVSEMETSDEYLGMFKDSNNKGNKHSTNLGDVIYNEKENSNIEDCIIDNNTNDENKMKVDENLNLTLNKSSIKTTKNMEFGTESEYKEKHSISIGLSPIQSPPLLALTPSTPVPIIQNTKMGHTNVEMTCSIETVKTVENNPTPICSSVNLLGDGEIKESESKRKTCDDKNSNSGDNTNNGEINNNDNEVNDNNDQDGDNDDEHESKRNFVSIEDSPLPPKPIRRLTGDKEKEIKHNNTIKEDKTYECEQTPVLKGGNLEGTPKEMNISNKVDSRIEEDGENDGKTDFARPERLSYIKRSGLRSILNHSANRVFKENHIGSGPGSASGSRSFHLVKTPTGKYGFYKCEVEGKDKQQKLGIGESPCRRYHKRLKLLPPINPEECYELTDSEDDTNNQIGVNGESKVNRTQKRIPLWARSMNWIPKMKEQRNVDPFSIFGDSCMFMDLEDVFQRPLYISTVARDNRIKSWQNDRVTSLNWSEDSLTSDELKQYKLRMNYYIDKSSEVYVTEPCFTPSPNPMVNGAWNHINKQRINSGGTTVIRKALNLSVHRLNSNNSQKLVLQNNCCSTDENNNSSNIHQNNDFHITNS